jgi:hypothetical protein
MQRPREFFEKLVSRRNLNTELMTLLAPRLPRHRSSLTKDGAVQFRSNTSAPIGITPQAAPMHYVHNSAPHYEPSRPSNAPYARGHMQQHPASMSASMFSYPDECCPSHMMATSSSMYAAPPPRYHDVQYPSQHGGYQSYAQPHPPYASNMPPMWYGGAGAEQQNAGGSSAAAEAALKRVKMTAAELSYYEPQAHYAQPGHFPPPQMQGNYFHASRLPAVAGRPTMMQPASGPYGYSHARA